MANSLRDQYVNVATLEGLRSLAVRLGGNAHVLGSLAYYLERANQCDEAEI